MWQEKIAIIIRSLIGDHDSEKYSDGRLVQVAAVSAYTVNSMFSFANGYKVNVAHATVTPDPFELEDHDFNVLTAYKAACIIISGEVKVQAGNSISIKDGPSAINLTGIGKDLQVAAKTVCGQFEEMMYQFRVNTLAGSGVAILGPYSPGSDNINYNRWGDHRWQ